MIHKDNLLDATSTALANHPITATGTVVGSGAIGIMNVLTPYIEFITLIIGFTIGTLTLYGMLQKLFKQTSL